MDAKVFVLSLLLCKIIHGSLEMCVTGRVFGYHSYTKAKLRSVTYLEQI